MASQLRLRVVLPVAVLGVLGLGIGAFATTRSAPGTADPGPVPPGSTSTHKEHKNKKPEPTKPPKQAGPKPTPLQAALTKHGVVVVLCYAPGDGYDTIQTRETRAGALAANAGFLALNVKKNKQVAGLAAQFDVRQAPATLVFTRGPRLAYRVAGFLDRDAVAQAVA